MPCYMLARNKVKQMTLLGIPDPMVWMAYVGSVACVVFCVVYGHFKCKQEEAEEDEQQC